MHFARRLPAAWLFAWLTFMGSVAPHSASAACAKNQKNLPQETGFLNRNIQIRGVT
jgi:hypothetical protein